MINKWKTLLGFLFYLHVYFPENRWVTFLRLIKDYPLIYYILLVYHYFIINLIHPRWSWLSLVNPGTFITFLQKLSDPNSEEINTKSTRSKVRPDIFSDLNISSKILAPLLADHLKNGKFLLLKNNSTTLTTWTAAKCVFHDE